MGSTLRTWNMATPDCPESERSRELLMELCPVLGGAIGASTGGRWVVESMGYKGLQRKRHNPIYHGLMFRSKSLDRSSSFVVPSSMPPIALNPSSWAFIPRTPQYFDARTRYRATPQLQSRKVQSSGTVGTSTSSGAPSSRSTCFPARVSQR